MKKNLGENIANVLLLKERALICARNPANPKTNIQHTFYCRSESKTGEIGIDKICN